MITLARTLLHHDGTAGLALFLLASVGAVHALFSCVDFLLEHFEVSRAGRFRLGRRWYRPRAIVLCHGERLRVRDWVRDYRGTTWVLAETADVPVEDEEGCIVWYILPALDPSPTRRERNKSTVAA